VTPNKLLELTRSFHATQRKHSGSSTTLRVGEIPQGAGIFLLGSQSLRSCECLLMPEEELQTREAGKNQNALVGQRGSTLQSA